MYEPYYRPPQPIMGIAVLSFDVSLKLGIIVYAPYI
jgi:hypothetical protein